MFQTGEGNMSKIQHCQYSQGAERADWLITIARLGRRPLEIMPSNRWDVTICEQKAVADVYKEEKYVGAVCGDHVIPLKLLGLRVEMRP